MTWHGENIEADYQHMADQINFAMGAAYTAEDVRSMIAAVVRRPVQQFEFREILTDGFGIIQFMAPKQPDRVYRVNPAMSALDMLRRAISDVENGRQ